MQQPPKNDSHSIGRQLARELLRHLDLARYPVQQVRAGTVRRPGQQLDSLPHVEVGSLSSVMHITRQGLSVVPLEYHPGEIALLSTLFGSGPLNGDLIAAAGTRVRWLPVRDIEATLSANPDLLLLLVRFFALRLREVQARERGWLQRGVRGRVCAVLARIAQETNTAADPPWTIHATHEMLALRCGVSRPRLSSELKALERSGVLQLRRGSVEILRPDALQAAGAGE